MVCFCPGDFSWPHIMKKQDANTGGKSLRSSSWDTMPTMKMSPWTEQAEEFKVEIRWDMGVIMTGTIKALLVSFLLL